MCLELLNFLHFQAINITYTENGWNGLEYGNTDSLLDGNVGSTSWMYAIGAISKYGSGLPGPTGEVSVVELYVKCNGKFLLF